MKYKDYNLIIKEYQLMAKQALSSGNTTAAKNCQTIVEDLELIRSQGGIGLIKGTKEK
jgi:hypothetical protein|tara:strand:- start:442 stop:615 length:174 start_codon:yes stop_codon:yes gene_type:complete